MGPNIGCTRVTKIDEIPCTYAAVGMGSEYCHINQKMNLCNSSAACSYVSPLCKVELRQV
jgi:hypothetical protein